MADITTLILADHEWLREQFARLDYLQARTGVKAEQLQRVWRPLADKLHVHAYIGEKDLLSTAIEAWYRRSGSGAVEVPRRLRRRRCGTRRPSSRHSRWILL
jgi:hypothetical protein